MGSITCRCSAARDSTCPEAGSPTGGSESWSPCTATRQFGSRSSLRFPSPYDALVVGRASACETAAPLLERTREIATAQRRQSGDVVLDVRHVQRRHPVGKQR